MKTIKTFEDFSKHINESDGFGTYPFLLRKDKGSYSYFFKLEGETKGLLGFQLMIGKYSEYEQASGAKNSYAVLNISQVSPEIIDNIAINKAEVPDMNDESFSLSDNELARLLGLVENCVYNYLEQNPKVVRFYDEMQDNLQVNNYMEYLKSNITSRLGQEWSAQEGSSKKVIIISR